MADQRNATSPPPTAEKSLLTPEEIKRIELNRLRGTRLYEDVRVSIFFQLILFYHSKSEAETTRTRSKFLINAKCEPETTSRSGPGCVHFTDCA